MTSPKGKTRRRPATKKATDRVVSVSPSIAPSVSPSLEVLEGLDIHSSFTSLEARLDSLEIDLARQQGSREDDARRIAGDLAVMKARVEDALDAFAQTAKELRASAKSVEKRSSAAGVDMATVRMEIDARIDGATAAIGDFLKTVADDIGSQMGALGAQIDELQGTVEGLTVRLDVLSCGAGHDDD